MKRSILESSSNLNPETQGIGDSRAGRAAELPQLSQARQGLPEGRGSSLPPLKKAEVGCAAQGLEATSSQGQSG
jgi:hypothetical protein